MAREGVLKFPKQVDTGWGGEAMGKNKAAMAIEGNWFVGGVKSDYPNLKYTVVPLPAGPRQQAHAVVHELLGHRGQEQEPGRGDRPGQVPDLDRPADRRSPRRSASCRR